jgi:hypothetical protein
MANKLADSRLEEVWYALSGAFVDHEVNYAFVVKTVYDANFTEEAEEFSKWVI